MSDTSSPIESHSYGRLLLSLVLSRATTQLPGIISGLLLMDIGLTFGSPVGVTGQLQTISSTIALIFALLMGILSVRFKHKSLLLMGLFSYSVSALGCSLSMNFTMMLLLFSLTGLARAMVDPMSNTIVGETLPLEKRSKAMSWLFTGMAISYLIGSPIVGYIAGYCGWRMAFLGYMMPFSIMSLTLAFIGIPSETNDPNPRINGGGYLDGFKMIISNKSAIACLIGAALTEATWMSALTYSISFFRQRFLIPTSWASFLLSGMALCCVIGSLSSVYLINKFGRKSIAVISALFLGILSITFFNLHIFWLSAIIMSLNSIFTAIRYAASDSLTLEQVPEFRGTMMSINSAAYSLGSALGVGLGGLFLIVFGYGGLGMSLGTLGIVGTFVYYLFSIDPTRS